MIALTEQYFVILIYALCSYRNSGSIDFGDPNFINLARDVETMSMELDSKFDHNSIESVLQYDQVLKKMAGDRVELEILARQLFLLLLFNQNPQLTPKIFFREQMNGGSLIIGQLIRELKIYHPGTIADMLGIVYTELQKYLKGQGLVIALDEAHIADNYILHGKLISEKAIGTYRKACMQNAKLSPDFYNTLNIKCEVSSKYQHGFLTPLCAALSSLPATLIVLGTAFSLLNADHVYSASSKPNESHICITDFPSADENDVGDILNLLLDMTNCKISPSKKQRLTGQLPLESRYFFALM